MRREGWVLEQISAARAFYRSFGGIHVETARVSGPTTGYNGSPTAYRVAWPHVSSLASAGVRTQLRW
jgi:hypothetical protein